MARPQPRELKVIRCTNVSPNMRRITLGGPGYQGFPVNQAGAYIKLLIQQNEGEASRVRTFTVRAQHNDTAEIDVDFMLHGDEAPASAWAQNICPGESITVGGPGPRKTLDAAADWILVAGDMTALPALSVNLELLPDDAKGYAIIEILSQEDVQSLQAPAGIEIDWVVNPSPHLPNTILLDAVMSKGWLPGRPSIWAACEFETMRALRRYFKQERNVGKRELYVSSYWKRGLSEDEHKVVKKQDSDVSS